MRAVAAGMAPIVLWATLATPRVASAASVAELAKNLREHEDFRVRTQAALALGASGSADAVKPLCGGLDDGNDSVRAAAAAGLGRLKKGGVDCLKKRAKTETSTNVKKMLTKAIGLIEEAATGPGISKSTKFYLAFGKTVDKTGRGNGEIDTLVRRTLTQRASLVPDSAVAPAGETTDDANKLLRRYRDLEAFLLEPTVDKPEYSDGQLSVRLEVLIYSYPQRSLQGNVVRRAAAPGVRDQDVAKENQLIEALCEAAMQQFAELVAQLD